MKKQSIIVLLCLALLMLKLLHPPCPELRKKAAALFGLNEARVQALGGALSGEGKLWPVGLWP